MFLEVLKIFLHAEMLVEYSENFSYFKLQSYMDLIFEDRYLCNYLKNLKGFFCIHLKKNLIHLKFK